MEWGGAGGKLSKLVPLLHKYSFLWTKPSVLQSHVVVQVCEFPSGEVGDELKAFIGITFRLDVSHQGLRKGENQNLNGHTITLEGFNGHKLSAGYSSTQKLKTNNIVLKWTAWTTFRQRFSNQWPPKVSLSANIHPFMHAFTHRQWCVNHAW